MAHISLHNRRPTEGCRCSLEPLGFSRGNSGEGEGVGAAIVTARSRPSIIIS